MHKWLRNADMSMTYVMDYMDSTFDTPRYPVAYFRWTVGPSRAEPKKLAPVRCYTHDALMPIAPLYRFVDMLTSSDSNAAYIVSSMKVGR